MKGRIFTIFGLFAAICLSLLAATETSAQRYSGRATAIKTTVGVPLTNPLTTAINDTGELPSAGGDIQLASASTTIAGAALTAGASSSRTRGGTNASHSETSVANLNFSVLGNTITATAVSTVTDCSCPAGTCTGSTMITGLTLNGSSVTVDGTASQTILLSGPLGTQVGTLVINEQIDGTGSKTVNGLHVRVTDSTTGIVTDVVVASSHSDIICAPLATANFYSGRAYGIGSTVTTNDILLGRSSVATLVADTGPLPRSGGSIGPVVVAGAAIPGVATSGTLTTNTSGGISGGNRVSDSSANVQNLNATVAGFRITATVLNSETHCSCALGGTTSTCTGGAVITNLLITTPLNGRVTGTVTANPNSTVTLEVLDPITMQFVVVATLIFNEQIPVSPTTGGSITVNALHIITSTNVPAVSTSTTDTVIASSHSDIECGTISPSAGVVSVSGQVLSSERRPVSRAIVTLTNGDGDVLTAMTNPFGYFRFDDVAVGQTYVADISAKRYLFAPQAITINDELTGVTFVAQP
ncbi:MAG: choice-of-anchor P family protein [Pyrinomonadaceae bacterium]